MLETTKEERARWLTIHNYATPHPQDERIMRLIRDVDTLEAENARLRDDSAIAHSALSRFRRGRREDERRQPRPGLAP